MNTQNPTDTELVARCRDGDMAAWELLVTRYERLVYAVPMRYGLSSTECDDVFQTTWTTLLNQIDNIRQPDRISGWLAVTAKRACWDLRRGGEYERTTSTDPADLAEFSAETGPSPDQIVSEFETYTRVQGGLAKLGDRCRNLLQRLYYDPRNPSYNTIAQELDMAVGAIGPTRARCLKKLKELLS